MGNQSTPRRVPSLDLAFGTPPLVARPLACRVGCVVESQEHPLAEVADIYGLGFGHCVGVSAEVFQGNLQGFIVGSTDLCKTRLRKGNYIIIIISHTYASSSCGSQ